MPRRQKIDHANRICEVEGCDRIGKHLGKDPTVSGGIRRGPMCSMHSDQRWGLNGWDYKIHRKEYCENIDGRLGFICTSTIIDVYWQLDTDHIDGNPSNNDPENLQTLCKCCHAIKTKNNKDYLTDGRKKIKKASII